MGLDAASIGSASVVRAVRARQLACGFERQEDYLTHLLSQGDELQALVESLVVNETWFFREREALGTLAAIAQAHTHGAQGPKRLRVLSLPCATGEEPYSIVMTLVDAGLSPDQFQVDAVDISGHALRLARQARFGSNSFRGGDLGFRDVYFTHEDGEYLLADRVKLPVQFFQGNLFSADFLPGSERYDVIFFRNILIYFNAQMQTRALGVVDRLLADEGFLFAGLAEGSLLTSRQFVAKKITTSYAFQKSGSSATAAPAVTARPQAATLYPQAQARQSPPARIAALARPLASQPQPPRVALKATLEQVSLLADQGKLEQAASLCTQVLDRRGPSAQGHYLMGLIRDATGDSRAAIEGYRKALYLDSTHLDALMHLSSLLERQGDLVGAGLLRARFQRARRIGSKK